MTGETGEPDPSCSCTPAWPGLVTYRDDGSVLDVLPSTTPGGLARLYHASCRDCGARWPGAFRVPPRHAAA